MGVLSAPIDLSTPHGGQREVMYFVPELLGAFTFDAALTSRFDGTIDGYDLGLPGLGGDFGLGWRHYLDGWGAAALGANVGLGFWHAQDDRRPEVLHPRLSLQGRLRGISPTFLTFGLGVYAEAGPVFLSGGRPPPDFPDLAGAERGFSWSAGVETGPGKLVSLSPWVFGEVMARVGVESTTIEGRTVSSLTAGLRLGFDWTVLR